METVQENEIWPCVEEVACVKVQMEIKGSSVCCDSVSQIRTLLKSRLAPECKSKLQLTGSVISFTGR